MNILSPAGVTILLLFCLAGYCGAAECNEVNVFAIAENYSLEVSASFSADGSVLSLKCTLSHGDNLLPEQELVWTEGGLEILSRENGDMTVHQSNTSTLLTIYNVSPGLHYGAYGCRCHNRHSYTTNMLRKLIDKRSYVQYCSSTSTTVAAPEEVPISSHYVSTPGQVVHITCNQSDAVLMKAYNGSLVEYSSSINVSSPNDQGKFVCIKDNAILEVHYVIIKDYHPLHFIFPLSSGTIPLPFAIGMKTPPSLCAVYSSLELTHFFIEFKIGRHVFPAFRKTYSKNGPIGEGMWSLTIIPNEGNDVVDSIDLYCTASTVWESVTTSRYQVDFYQSSEQPTPSVCVMASLTPSAVIMTGSSVTINCNITFDLQPLEDVIISHFSEDGLHWKRNMSLSSCVGLHQNMTCSYTIEEVTSEGNYTCSFFGVTDTVILAVIETDETSSAAAVLSTILPTSVTKTIAGISSSSSTGIISNSTPTSAGAGSQVKGSTLLVVSISLGLFLVALVVSGFSLLCFSRLCSMRKKRGESVKDGPIEAPPFQRMLTLQQSLAGFDEALLNGLKLNDMESVSLSLASASPSLLNQLRPSIISKMMAECLQELQSSDWYIPYYKLTFEGELGSGAFGTVKKARVAGVKGEGSGKVVAVKMLKCLPSEEDMRDIITEFNILKHVGRHENIVGLLGASEHKGQLLVIVEFCAGGNLLQYLRRKRQDVLDPLTTVKQIEMGLQVSRGMAFLSTQKCVHRDLAARNILLDHEGILKVADFGLARETLYSIYTKTSKGKIPFKWMSPESIFDKIYTSKSDVWSFGVLLMEIITLGQTPYPGKTVDEVIECLRSRKTMTKPQSCPSKVYDIMKQCWQFDPKLRPSFYEMITILEQFLADYRPESPSYVVPTDEDEGVSSSNDTNSTSPLPLTPPTNLESLESHDSGHQELPTVPEMYTALMSCDPGLAEDLQKLCPDCQTRCLQSYYCNYISVGSDTSFSSEDSNGSVRIYTRRGGNSKGPRSRNIKFGKYSLCLTCRALASGTHNGPGRHGNTLTAGQMKYPPYVTILGEGQDPTGVSQYTTHLSPFRSSSDQRRSRGRSVSFSPSRQYESLVKTPLSCSPRHNNIGGGGGGEGGREREGAFLKGQCQVVWDSQSTTSGGYIQTVV